MFYYNFIDNNFKILKNLILFKKAINLNKGIFKILIIFNSYPINNHNILYYFHHFFIIFSQKFF